MNLTLRILSLVCAGWPLVGAACAQSRPIAPVTLTVTTTPVSAPQGYAIPPDFSGLGFERGTLSSGNAGASGYFFSPTNTQLVTLFQNLGVKNLRIGGGSVDDESPVGTGSDGYLGIDNLFGFAQAAGLKVLYSMRLLNPHGSIPNLMADDAAAGGYIWSKYQTNLQSFAIGNEPDFYSYHIVDPLIYQTLPGRANAGTAFPSYLADWQNFAAAIEASAPGALFSGPDSGSYNGTIDYNGVPWTISFANAEKGSGIIADITQHLYVGGSLGIITPQQAIDDMLSPGWATSTELSPEPEGSPTSSTYTPYPWLYVNDLAPIAADNFPYRLTESDDFLGGINGASNAFSSALWTLDYMQSWAAHNAGGVNFHNKQWIYTDTIVPNPNPCIGTCGNYQTTPKGYGIKAFDLGGHGYVEPIAISNPNNINVTAYAVGEGQDLYVTIINKTHSSTNDVTDAVVTIQPQGFPSASAASMVLTDGTPGNAALMTATLGSASISNNARWLGQWTPLDPDTSGSVTVTVPSTTAAVVKIHAASNYAGPIQIDQNGTLEIFGTRTNGDNWHPRQNDDTDRGGHDGGDTWHDSQKAAAVPNSSLENWNGWTDFGGGVLSKGGTAVVKNLNNALEIFIPSTTGDVYHNYELTPNGAWSGWIDMGASSNGITDLQAANNADGSLSVFGIGTNGDIWYASQSAPGVGWSSWIDLSGEQIQRGFVVGQNLNGNVEVFGADSSGNVWYDSQTAGTWSGWNSLSGESVNPRLAIARNLDGRLEIFGVDRNFNVWHNWQTSPGGTWNGWSEIKGKRLQSGFVIGQNKDGRLVLFGVEARDHDSWRGWGWGGFGQNGEGQRVWSSEQQSPGDNFWGDWTDLGGSHMDPQLVVGNTADGRIQLFGTAYNQDVWSDWQLNTGDGWAGWTDFGGKGIKFYPNQLDRR